MPTPTPTTTATVTMSTTSSSSSRWCPTPEQLMILEEMYRAGIRTPNASQIQNITAHLLSYGKIEGKNVFYWFQNHKARDRQRLRRKLSKRLQLGHHLRHRHHHHHHQLCFQQSPNHVAMPHQPQPQQILNHQHGSINNCFFQYVSELSPQSHSSQSGRASCCPSCFLQGGTMGAATSPRSVVSNIWPVKGAPDDDKVEADRMSVKRSIYGRSLNCMLTMDMSRSCLHYLPQPLKTLDLFPTAATNLREEHILRQGT